MASEASSESVGSSASSDHTEVTKKEEGVHKGESSKSEISGAVFNLANAVRAVLPCHP